MNKSRSAVQNTSGFWLPKNVLHVLQQHLDKQPRQWYFHKKYHHHPDRQEYFHL